MVHTQIGCTVLVILQARHIRPFWALTFAKNSAEEQWVPVVTVLYYAMAVLVL